MIFEIVVLLIILGFAMKGLKEGLIVSVCSLLTLFLAIVITQTVSPVISRQVQQNKTVVNFMSTQIEDILSVDENTSDSDNESTKVQKNEIENLPIPIVLKKLLISNNNVQSYKAVGAENFKKYISLYVAIALINCMCYIIVFLITVLVLKALVHGLDIVSHLPVIHTLNKLGGFLAGGLKGLIVVWFIFIIVIIGSSAGYGRFLYDEINDSVFLKFLFDNNLILNAIVYIMNALFK